MIIKQIWFQRFVEADFKYFSFSFIQSFYPSIITSNSGEYFKQMEDTKRKAGIDYLILMSATFSFCICF